MELYIQPWGYQVPASLENVYVSHGDDKTIGLKATLIRDSSAQQLVCLRLRPLCKRDR